MTSPRLFVRPGDELTIAAAQVNWINGQMRSRPERVEHQSPGQIQTVVVKFAKSSWSSDWGIAPTVGHAIGLPPALRWTGIKNLKLPKETPPGFDANRVSAESDLIFPSPDVPPILLDGPGQACDTFGVIMDLGAQGEDYFALLAVAGVIACRAIAWGPGDRLVGPPPWPRLEAAQPLWRPYATIAPAGGTKLLATGGYFQLGDNPWPRVYDVIASL
jgi:hypothetical protein